MSELIAEIYCPSCGYDLRGIDSPRCPECGLDINPELIRRSVIPWTHREQIGRWNAFRRTVWFIMRNPRGIGRDVARRVDYLDAQKFRWLVVLAAWVPVAAVMLVARAILGDHVAPKPAFYWSAQPTHLLADAGICLWAGCFLWPVPALAWFLMLATITGAPSFFFRPAGLPIVRQNRAVAISFYACAPLALLVVPLVMLLVSVGMVETHIFFMRGGLYQTFIATTSAGLALTIALPVVYWGRALHLLHATTQCSPARLWTTAILLPLIWLVLAGLTLGLFPILWGLVKLMIVSYWN